MVSVRVPNFLASTRGFRFANSWNHTPLINVSLGQVGQLSLGDAANGLCGGMSFTVADVFLGGLTRPDDAFNPPGGSARFDYIVSRQLASFEGIAVPLRFYSLMGTWRPEREPFWAGLFSILPIGGDRHSRTWTMIKIEWPRIRQALDKGQIAMLGLVQVVSDDPAKLGKNHQVVAYGYDLDGSMLKLHIYDPNYPGDDTVTLTLNLADPRGVAKGVYSKYADPPIHCFFMAPYAKRDPIPWRSPV